MVRYFILFLGLLLILTAVSFQEYGLQERIPNTSFRISTSGDTLASMQLLQVFGSVDFTLPVYLFHAGDGRDRIFIVEKGGIIKVMPRDYSTTAVKIFMNISSRVNARPNEAGLLSVAFHPAYASNGKLYVYYTYGDLISRISEFTVSSNPDSVATGSERILLEVEQPYDNHNGGQLAFGPDGYLYIGLGDGGSGGDPQGNGQNRATLLGKILRIDINNTDPGLAYAIPQDNPLAGNNNNWRKEIWAWGLRNPWRFSFDRLSGDLWAADVGQNIWEEVDLISGGRNYGWNIMEGFHCYRPSTNCDTSGLTLPVVEYDHDAGNSITGGYVYRSNRLIRLNGIYLYGDYVTRKIWGLKYSDGQVVENKIIAESPAGISSFGEDETGEVYVVGYDGRIFIFDEKPGNPPPVDIPKTISASGVFSSIESLTYSPGIIPYSINAPFWSDGAYKTRALALPDTSKIVFSRDGFWTFPAGAILVKNFFVELEEGNPDSRKIIETRFLVKHQQDEQWDGFSYLWNEEETDAVLLEGGYHRPFNIQSGDSIKTQTYYYPSRSECLDCHTPAAGYVLGVRTAQINKQHQYGEVADNQLRSYNHIRLFTNDIGEDYSTFPRLPSYQDGNTPIQQRARAYLDANCANCHRPGGSGRTDMDFRYETSLEEMQIIGEEPSLGDMNIDGAMRLQPGAADSSIIYLRMRDLGEYRMPPLASSVVDAEGAEIIRRWIDTLAVILQLEDQESYIPGQPHSYYLFPVYPNPFNPTTKIKFALPEQTQAVLEIYNLHGQKIVTLVDSVQQAGYHIYQFDGTGLASGIYMCRLKADNYTMTRKLVLVR
jgi:uncharacterized repeat protein (TIGR03806 family)